MRHWLITGISSGLGRALAETALDRGDRVTGTIRDPDAHAAFIALAPGRASAVALDVTDRMAIARTVAAAGPIDILVNNAGFSLEGMLEATSIDEIQCQIDVHLIAPVLFIQAVLPGMRKRRAGHIISIGSLAAHLAGSGVAAYAAAKAALETVSDNLASELSPFGISVTTVVPGAFRTGLGLSRRSASGLIEDYASADETMRAWFAAHSASPRGDPAKAAGAIFALTEMENPPVTFAMGPDAIAGMRSHAADLLQCAQMSQGLNFDTDF